MSQLAGEWKDDRRHGQGTVMYMSAEGKVVERYEGQWNQGMRTL